MPMRVLRQCLRFALYLAHNGGGLAFWFFNFISIFFFILRVRQRDCVSAVESD